MGQTRASVLACSRDKLLSERSTTPVSETAQDDSPQEAQLVVVEKRTFKQRLHRAWKKLAVRRKKSRDIRTALKCAARDGTKSISELQAAVEVSIGSRLTRNRKAFFDKCVQKMISAKAKARRKRRRLQTFVLADASQGNPIQEFNERQLMRLEDYLSNALRQC
jgi:hypothetical protein